MAAALFVLAIGGCDERTAPPGVPAAVVRDETPEGRLKDFQQRLDDALQRARAASGWGVNSTRRARVRLIPPQGEGELYTAKVFIETHVGLAPGAVAEAANRRKAAGGGKKLGRASTEPIDPSTGIAKAASTVTTRDYMLVFKGQRWELAEPLPDDAPETEKICFQIALSDE
jgi:hypothetical protein